MIAPPLLRSYRCLKRTSLDSGICEIACNADQLSCPPSHIMLASPTHDRYAFLLPIPPELHPEPVMPSTRSGGIRLCPKGRPPLPPPPVVARPAHETDLQCKGQNSTSDVENGPSTPSLAVTCKRQMGAMLCHAERNVTKENSHGMWSGVGLRVHEDR